MSAPIVSAGVHSVVGLCGPAEGTDDRPWVSHEQGDRME